MIFGSKCTDERIFALAGVVQCAAVVNRLATQGEAETDLLTSCIDAFFLRNDAQIAEYFKTPGKVKLGLTQLGELFSGNSSDDSRRQANYAFQMVHLSKQMAQRPDMLGVIGADIDRMQMQTDQLDNYELQTQIGELYQKTISKLSFRIQVQGQNGYLRREQTASSIRAILFCGIRFAHLWRQQGGTQMDFLFRKSQIRNISGRLAQDAKSNFH